MTDAQKGELLRLAAEIDESLDAVDRAASFLSELSFLLHKHRVKVVGSWRDLQQCELTHDDPANGWSVDMQDIQTLIEEKNDDQRARDESCPNR